MATLGYGWESPKFYSDCMGGKPDLCIETAGAKPYSLQPLGDNYLEFECVFHWIIDTDSEYAKRIERAGTTF